MARRPGTQRVLAVARGDEPADLLLHGGRRVRPPAPEWPQGDLARVGVPELEELLELGSIGVAEVMNFPAVIAGDAEFRAKIAAAGKRRVDGHAPGVRGPALDAYLAAGIESDHESTGLDEINEKRR